MNEKLNRLHKSSVRWTLNTAGMSDVYAVMAEIENEFKELQSRLESLEKDAARYRWLRNNWLTMSASYENNVVRFYINGKRYSEASEEDLDVTIDTAMQAQGKTND